MMANLEKNPPDDVIAGNDHLKDWTSEERQKFLDLYKIYPKEFAKISAGLGTKTTKQCVHFFYHRHLEKIELPIPLRSTRRPAEDNPTPKANENHPPKVQVISKFENH